MNFNKLLLLNTINLVMLGLVLFSQSFLAMPIVIAFVIFWFAFVCASNYIMLNNSKISQDIKFDKASKGLFAKEISRTKQTLKSVDARAPIFEDTDNATLKDVYEKLKHQIYTNVDYITKYIDAYDYIMKPISQREKISNLIDTNDMLISKLNVLVEQMISVDESVSNIDTAYVDDLIDALKTVSQPDFLENKYK